MNQILHKLQKNPKKVFLIDALGAFISLFSFLCILTPLQVYFGTPTAVLSVLSICAIVLFVYSFSCYKWIQLHWKPYLKIIIIINSLYTAFSIGLIFYHFNQLTFLGFSYFCIEIGIIFMLIYLEIRTFFHQKEMTL
jgi:hypothetical protein